MDEEMNQPEEAMPEEGNGMDSETPSTEGTPETPTEGGDDGSMEPETPAF